MPSTEHSTTPTSHSNSHYYNGSDVFARQYVLRHSTVKGIQTFSLIVPPILLLRSLRTRSFNLNKFMRANTIAGLGGGAAFGFGAGYARLRSVDEHGVEDRAERLRHNWGQNTVDDYSLTSAFIGSLATTAFFLRRASPIWLLPGGASLGIAGGVIAHLIINWDYVKNSGSISSSPMVTEVEKSLEELGDKVKK